MKKHYTGSDEPKKIWDAVYRHAKNKGGLYLPDGKDYTFYSYEQIISDAIGASIVLEELTDPSDPVTVGAGIYDIITVILACSLISRHVIISDERDEMTFGGLVITDKNTHFPKFISPEELRVLISGAVSGNDDIKVPDSKAPIDISFRSSGLSITYGEQAALLAAIAFQTGCALSRKDNLLSLFSPSSENGFICGILAPLITGASVAAGERAEIVIRYMKSLSPTKLLCSRTVASALILKLLRIKKLHPRPDRKRISLSIDPSFIWLNRLYHPRISYLLGGKLKTVITLGELSPVSAKAFFSFGIYSISMHSISGLTPSLFHYGEDRRGEWKLPVGACADICNTQKGGTGTIVISAPHVRKGDCSPNTYIPYEKPSSTSLVTPLCGFVTKKGGVFVIEE